MPPTRWATLLDRDYIVSCYLDECSPQMLLFLNTIRTMGVSPSLLALDLVPSDTLSEGILSVLTARQQIQSVLTSLASTFPKDSVSPEVDCVNFKFEQAFLTFMNFRDVLAELQLHLTSAGVELVDSLKIAKGDQIDVTKVEKFHESMKQLLLSTPVAPSHFLPRLLWTAALSLETCKDLEETLGRASPAYGKVCLCMPPTRCKRPANQGINIHPLILLSIQIGSRYKGDMSRHLACKCDLQK